jgi:cytochrome b subunit of formate dehydrogenase
MPVVIAFFGTLIMRLKSFPTRVLLSWLLAAVLSPAVLAATNLLQDGAPTPATTLENASCQSCHDGRKGKLEVPGAEGTPRALKSVASDAFAKGVHAKMQCVACHTDITDNAETANTHQKKPAQPLNKVDCAGCHQGLFDKAQKDGTAKDKPQLEVVVKNIEAYKVSFHARPNADDKSKPNASCDNCHDTHSFNVPAAKDSPQYAQWRLSIPKTCGESCHEDQLEAYAGSVHGQEISQKLNAKSAVCSDCHGTHTVGNSSAVPFKLGIGENCGSCHEANFKSYKATYHGQINTLGYANTAKCFDCHGSHEILKVADTKSKVHADNRMKTCRQCHNGKKDVDDAPAGFASFQPHGHAGDFDRYPQIWIAWQIMLQLLVGTFAFFWLHTALWFYREYKERRQRSGQPRVKAEALPAHLQGKHVKRFSRTWRIAHLTFALSLMILTLTGMPLFYPEAPWAATLMRLLGGPDVAGNIHRVAAVVFASVFFWHLFYIAVRIARDWKNFKFFGPNSLIPNLQDGKDMLAMFTWFFGKGPRPVFERWTYWEKFDYWAPFWGVTIIGVSGLIMWLPNVFGAFLPGWVFNVAAIFHGEEAFLAVVFLFTVHFFNNHFRPDKFPLDVVMFTGTWSLEEFKHEHAVQYKRLVDAGELEKYLVAAPSSAKLAASKVLGFSLIAMGLSLLTLVGIGFFTG